MLLAVEGGGFFSSSASGFSKFLTLLLLGQRNEDKPMRVTPWNQYQETDPDPHLAPRKNRIVRGCASFVCFGGAAAGPENSSPLKVGPDKKQEVLPEPLDLNENKDQAHPPDPVVVNDDGNRKVFGLKSSLKRTVNDAPLGDDDGNINTPDVSFENGDDITYQMERRRVQWTDTTGGELFEIREFEMSEGVSEDEYDNGTAKTCSCIIM